MSDELVHTFFLLFDKNLKAKADHLATVLRTTSGSIKLKTLEEVIEAKGATFGKKLDTVLNVFAHAVIIICSDTFAKFIDKKEKDNCPDLLVENFKDSHKVLKDFVKKESKKSPSKIILVAFDDNFMLPKDIKNMNVVKNEGNESAFHNHIIAEISGRK